MIYHVKAMAEPKIVEDFYGVYLLYCMNPRYKGRTYIGYTRDPNRRIMQHNRGTAAGGAYRTSNRGPWKMVMIVHGFPNNISALRFEWAWQNPGKTTRLQHLGLFKVARKETVFQFKLRVLTEMLRVGPWCRLPLIIRWLENDFREDFPIERKPPDHMIICQGPIKSRNLKNTKENIPSSTIECLLCSGYLNSSEKITCLNSNCDLVAHISCIAERMLPPGEYIPIEGQCPFCEVKLKWGDLIRKMKGCLDFDYNNDNVISTQRDVVDVCEESEELNNLINNEGEFSNKNCHDDVVCTQEVSDDPSWFLDCNEDL